MKLFEKNPKVGWTVGTTASHCDLCGKSIFPLVSLRDSYATNDIKWLCPDCEGFANDHLNRLREINHHWISRMLKVFLRQKRSFMKKGGGE